MEKLKFSQAMLPTLFILLVAICSPAFSQVTDSYCDSTGNISIQNINLKGGNFTAGQELQTINIPISYICYTFPKTFGPEYRPTLQINQNFRTIMNILSGAGLGLDITIQESGEAPVTFPWRDIKLAINSGSSVTKGFGRWLNFKPFPPVPATYPLTGTITIRIFVETKFTQTFANISAPSVSAFNLLAYDPTGISVKLGKPVTTSSFNLRFIPDSSGRVIISPSVVRMGHFYTEYNETMVAKETPFTVTAQQNIGTQTPFVAPLAIEFQTNGLDLADADSSVTLKNTKGETNGFRLLVMDEAGIPVKLNTKANMGSINLDNGSGGKIVKQYKVKVEPISGADIKTGNFSTAMTVVVTYI
ncbi:MULTISPECIES: adhesion protein [unclassified Providencia]|uniref:adhesion protein n=1 Tax=unclassified Providencia TaxID=2633465 RepID=UPI00234A6D93|nr:MULTISPECIES: adhesion protein [unclassified Providencia]